MPVKWVEEVVSSGEIPLPVYLDGHKRWREKEIDEWLEAGCPRTPQPGKTMNDVQASKSTLSLKQFEKEGITETTVGRAALEELVQSYEKMLILDALRMNKGSIRETARYLKTTERKIGYKIRKYGIQIRAF